MKLSQNFLLFTQISPKDTLQGADFSILVFLNHYLEVLEMK